MRSSRIEWIDILKALLIIFMVIGHITGQFNKYIYLFHMGAFFIVSGFTTNLGKRTFIEIVVNSFYRLIFPLLTIFLIFLIMVELLDFFNLYHLFFEGGNSTIYYKISQFFIGNNHINLLGATWFLPVLFFVIVIQKTVYDLFIIISDSLFYMISGILFLLGYFLITTTELKWFMLDTAFIGQGYFAIGVFLRNYVPSKWYDKLNITLLCAIIGGIGLIYFSTVFAHVDYPSRTFGHPAINFSATMCGFLFCYALSRWIEKLPTFFINIFSFTGKNTLGILLFHFTYFKLVTFVLMLLGYTNVDNIQSLLPPKPIGAELWYLYAFVSIAMSVFTWQILLKNKLMCILLGASPKTNKYFLEKSRFNKLSLALSEIFSHYVIRFIEKLGAFVILRKLYFIFAILILAIFIPYFATGVILNDELQARFYRKFGLLDGFLYFFEASVTQKNRYSMFFTPLFIMFSFLTENAIVNRIIQTVILLSAVGTFSYFSFKLFKDKVFSIMLALFIIAFIPFTFHHSIPNAFVGQTCILTIIIFSAFNSYISYISTNNMKYYVLAIILYVIALFSYEYSITFAPLFPLIYMYFRNDESKFIKLVLETIKNIIPFILISFIYLGVIYYIQQINSYQGASVGFISISSSFEILKVLFTSAIPGFFLTNDLYQYLFTIYAEKHFLGMLGVILSIRTFVIAICLATICYNFYKHYNKFIYNKMDVKKIAFYLIPVIALLYAILPATPLSIAAMYQGNVTYTSFTNLPVTFTLNLAISFFICWCLRNFVFTRGRGLILCCFIIFAIIASTVQIMNYVIIKEQQANFKRLETIEALFGTEILQDFNNQIVLAEDFYEPQNLLAIHNNFWTQYAQFMNINATFTNNPAEKYDVKADILADNVIALLAKNNLFLLSQKVLPVDYAYEYAHGKKLNIGKTQYVKDNTFYCYTFDLNAIELGFAAGYNKNTAIFKKGLYDDNWVAPFLEVNISTQEKGIIEIQGYYPNAINSELKIEILVNDVDLNSYTVSEQLFSIVIKTESNSEINLKTTSKFFIPATNQDLRDLSFVLVDITGD